MFPDDHLGQCVQAAVAEERFTNSLAMTLCVHVKPVNHILIRSHRLNTIGHTARFPRVRSFALESGQVEALEQLVWILWTIACLWIEQVHGLEPSIDSL